MVTIQEIPAEFQFDYDLDELKAIWPRLHAIDGEPSPSVPTVRALMAGQQVEHDQITEDLWMAWLDFHNGHFNRAFETGQALGAAGFYVAHLAANTYGSYFLPKAQQADYFETLITRGKSVVEGHADQINIIYVHALHLGRYAQSVSPVKALSSGIVPDFRKALENCLALSPGHIPSLLAHAALMIEAIVTMGELPARMGFGATRKKILRQYEQALELADPPPLVFLEVAKGLARLEKRKAKDKVKSLLTQAVSAARMDPMDALDIRDAMDLLKGY
ncbi:hypothetical protein [Alcanivorax sp. 1008]|uniref:hypothetical protein n=1 Tax=Alcanivorax sp. 1008 TaxID=2816853 RepID=UPI001DE97DEA|nr:hypothetical protein [Alcanivorax sp. 1008]MCC1495232.1 hypothetical protein [Alcanivorax sp. 1008]